LQIFTYACIPKYRRTLLNPESIKRFDKSLHIFDGKWCHLFMPQHSSTHKQKYFPAVISFASQMENLPSLMLINRPAMCNPIICSHVIANRILLYSKHNIFHDFFLTFWTFMISYQVPCFWHQINFIILHLISSRQKRISSLTPRVRKWKISSKKKQPVQLSNMCTQTFAFILLKYNGRRKIWALSRSSDRYSRLPNFCETFSIVWKIWKTSKRRFNLLDEKQLSSTFVVFLWSQEKSIFIFRNVLKHMQHCRNYFFQVSNIRTSQESTSPQFSVCLDCNLRFLSSTLTLLFFAIFFIYIFKTRLLNVKNQVRGAIIQFMSILNDKFVMMIYIQCFWIFHLWSFYTCWLQ
jgi:hypothetical protein